LGNINFLKILAFHRVADLQNEIITRKEWFCWSI